MTSAEPATRPPHDLDGGPRVIRLDYVALKGLLWVKRNGSKATERMTANGASFPFPLAPATSVVPLYRSSNPGGSSSRGPSFTTRGGDFCRLRCERSSISSRSIDATSRGRTRSCPRLLTILAFGMCGPRAGFPVLCRDKQTEAGAFHQRPAVSGELGLRK
jgi:hypothetical protein